MRLLLANPWFWLIVVAVSLAQVGGGYLWGHTAATTSCTAAQVKPLRKAKAVQDDRDANVEAIATATAAAVATALSNNQGTTHESVERIRTVEVPRNCRAGDPLIVRELQAGADDINAALRAGLRSGPAGAGAAGPVDAP